MKYSISGMLEKCFRNWQFKAGVCILIAGEISHCDFRSQEHAEQRNQFVFLVLKQLPLVRALV